MDAQKTIARKASRRLKRAYDVWDWAEFTRTEERAFRSVWNDERQFRRDDGNGFPDEFYFNGGIVTDSSGTHYLDPDYYRVLVDAPTDPPIGTAPSDDTYFETFVPEPFIERDQTCRRSIGQVLGVYGADPSINGNGFTTERLLTFQPSERGVKVTGVYDTWTGVVPNPPVPSSPATVFVWYQLPPSQFTMIPYIAGKTYVRGDRVYFAPPIGDGNCYRALASNSDPPSNSTFWALEPVPETLAEYLEAGTYADTIKDRINGEPIPPTAAADIAMAAEEAEECLRREIDKLAAQGQKHFYGSAKWLRWSGVWASQPWGGDKVVYLTDVCDSDMVFPPPFESPSVRRMYRPDIPSLRGPGQNALNTVPTTFLLIGSRIDIILSIQGSRRGLSYELLAGPADPADLEGQVAPLDYDSVTNNKHWSLIGT